MNVLLVVIAGIFSDISFASITINKIIMRVPKEDDIGLIFDVNVANTLAGTKEMMEYLIHSDGTCFLNITNCQLMCDAGRIVGGNFGFLDAGSTETVSLIWPTVSLYNRVGYCPILITAINPKNELCNSRQILHFDTRFTTLDPEGHHLRKRKEYRDCKNWDKDYLRNCTPVNCEERYFGKRSYYNYTTQRCEDVVRCSQSYEVYDVFANECINTRELVTDNDLENIKQGNYQDMVYLNCADDVPKTDYKSTPYHVVVNENTTGTCGHTQAPPWKHTFPREISEGVGESSSSMPYWLKGLADGLLIVFATLAIYVLICFIIFLIVSWISRRQRDNNAKCVVVSPTSSEGNIPLFTRSSLMSQR